MAIKKTYKKKKGTTRNKGSRYSRRSMIPKSIRFKTDEYHTVFNSTLVRNTAMSIYNDTNFKGIGITFQMSDCENFSNWERLFEEYRLNKVVVSFVPRQTEGRNRPVGTGAPTTQVPQNTQTPYMYYYIDRNDIVAPTDATVCMATKRCVRKLATEPHTIVFTPSTLVPVYQSQDPVSSNILYNYTIDYTKKFCQNNLGAISKETPYWGLKYGIDAASPPAAYNMHVSAKYYVTFRKRIQ